MASTVTMTQLVGHAYWDEEGHLHQHDPNVMTTDYTCTNGHAWRERERGRCWCGWGREPAVAEGEGR